MEDKKTSKLMFVHSHIDDAGLSQSAFRLYGHLIRRVGNNPTSKTGQRRIEKVCRMTRKTVAKATKELISRKLIEVSRQASGDTFEYRLIDAIEWHNARRYNAQTLPDVG